MDEQDVNEAAKLLAEDQDLSQAAKRLATVGAGDDIEALVILVMMEAAEDAAEDLKALMEQMRSANAAKRGMRELICKVASDVAENIGRPDDGKLVFKDGGLGGEAEYHRAPVPSPNPACEAGVLMVATDLHPGKIRTRAQLEAIREALEGRLDSLSEMSSVQALRLQMAMDRRSKMLEALSNIMKKASETQATIVQNMK